MELHNEEEMLKNFKENQEFLKNIEKNSTKEIVTFYSDHKYKTKTWKNEIKYFYDEEKNKYYKKESNGLTSQIVVEEISVEKLKDDYKKLISNGSGYKNYIPNKKEFENILNSDNKKNININDDEKQEHKPIKKTKEFKKYESMNLALKLKYLEEKGIKEGNVYKFETEKNGEKSLSYYQVVKDSKGELRLKKYNENNSLKSNTHYDQAFNADSIEGIKAFSILEPEFAKRMVNAKHAEKEKVEFIDDDFNLSFTDVTSIARKEERKTKINNKKEALGTENPKEIIKVNINKIPEDVKEFYKTKKGKELTEEQYTKNIFEMTKKILKVPFNKINLSNEDKELVKPLIEKYKKCGDNEKLMAKEFNQFVFDNNNKPVMEKYALLYKKTLETNFKGFDKKFTPQIEEDLDQNLEAIQKNKHPIQQDGIIPDYITNPVDNTIYKGNSQIALARNNLVNDIDAKAYAPADAMIKNGNIPSGMKPKCLIIATGKNNLGQNTYMLCVPCKPVKMSHSEKKEAKEEMRRNIFDAKFKYKTGRLPTFSSQLALLPDNQPPVITKNDVPQPKLQDIKMSTIGEQINNDIANYVWCALTKNEFKPCRDWTQEPAKSEFFEYAQSNPEKMIQMANLSFKNIEQKALQNTNTNTIENVQDNSHKEIPEQKKENINEITNKKGHRR